MATGEIMTASVEKLTLGGDGLALYEGKRLFIPLTAPGDIVEARITEDHGSWARAELGSLHEAGPSRIPPACPQYGKCGGCSLQHLSYNAQLEAKKAILADILDRNNNEMSVKAPPPITVIPSEPWEYRNRVSLHALRSNRFPRCAFKSRKSDALIPLEDCPVCDPGIRGILPRLLPPPGKDRFTLYSRDTVLLAETGTSLQEGQGLPPCNLPSRGKITLNTKDITLDASCFFQSNASALESLLVCITSSLSKEGRCSADNAQNGRMADLYAGVGTFSLFLGDLFPGGTDLLETDSRAMELAKVNLGSQTAPGKFRFFAQKDQQWIKKNDVSAYRFIVADPPRQGLSSSLTASLAKKGPPVFIYVSCEPSSFARDYRILLRRYDLTELFLFDFYPQTAHIECMGTFVQK